MFSGKIVSAIYRLKKAVTSDLSPPSKFRLSKTYGRSPGLQRSWRVHRIPALVLPVLTVNKSERSYGCGGSVATRSKRSVFPLPFETFFAKNVPRVRIRISFSIT